LPEPADSYDDLISSLEALGVAWGLAGALAAERYRFSPRDLDDIASILATGRSYDREYVERWVGYFGLEHRLHVLEH
jgi:hypothetical protein